MCSHERVYRDLEDVCMDCGLVLGQIYLHRGEVASRGVSVVNEERSQSNGGGDTPITLPHPQYESLRNVVASICSRLFLDNDSLATSVVDLLLREVGQGPVDLRLVGRRKLLAFCLWECLNRAGCPRPREDLAAICDLPANSVYSAESLSDIRPTFRPPSDFVEVPCAWLGIPYRTRLLITENVAAMEWEVEFVGVDPELLVAGCILLNTEGISMETLCETMALSQSSLSKLCERLRHRKNSDNSGSETVPPTKKKFKRRTRSKKTITPPSPITTA